MLPIIPMLCESVAVGICFATATTTVKTVVGMVQQSINDRAGRIWLEAVEKEGKKPSSQELITFEVTTTTHVQIKED